MRFFARFSLSLPLFFALFGGAALAGETIRLRPGQCIFVGSQEVCAMTGDDPAAPPRPTTLAACKYGDKESEPGMKGYTLVRVVLKDDGTKTETVVKAFGSQPVDKAECEREAAKLDARSPRP